MAKQAVKTNTKTNETTNVKTNETPAPQSLPATVNGSGTKEIALADDFDGSPSGLENVGAQDLLIPRLVIAQKLSPQLDKNEAEYIEGAEEGDFIDAGTNEVFKNELLVIPAFYVKVYLEWAPRNTGRGLIANHGTNAEVLEKCTQDDKKKFVLPNGNYIAETATFFVLNLTAGGRRSFIPLTSTQLKAGRRWLTLITNEKAKNSQGRIFTPPIYYRAWRATTVDQSNQEGRWKGWKFDPAERILDIDPSKALLAEAIDFHKQVSEGNVKADIDAMAAEQAAEQARSQEAPF